MSVSAHQSVNEWLSDILAALGGSAGGASALLKVQGAVAEGAAFTNNPVVVAGLSANGSGNARAPRVSQHGATGNSFSTGFCTNSQGFGYNGTTWDAIVNANTAHNTTGTGLRGVGNLNHDGANWQRALCDTTGTPRFGQHRTAIKSTPVVGTGVAYASGDVIGTKLTLASAVRVSGGTGRLMAVTVSNLASVASGAIPLRLWLFDADPSGSTFTDNAALNIVDADLPKVIGVVTLPTGSFTATAGEVWSVGNLWQDFKLASGTSLFAVLESRGAVAANAGVSDWQVTVVLEQD